MYATTTSKRLNNGWHIRQDVDRLFIAETLDIVATTFK